ncbi:YbaK/EbsC family protein [Vogesella indigofera]|uniref:YbaK/EbsC family protein n=1 Tax=Vogesella indigofera TaxID=45465 RepID=UPI00234F16EE|nr:YbaK/EbsC family protein [Vogesella indigofera]MDC7701886.1 YbaK/EbsC family protein [Vogesella indigofera]
MNIRDFARQFQFQPLAAELHPQHLPASVASQVQGQELIVFAVADEASDTEQFSARYGFGLEDCANTIVLRYKKDGVEQHAAVVTLGSRRLDVNGAVKSALGAQRLSFAKREVATALTGMEFGGITALGLPASMRILVDAAVMARRYVVVGAGVRHSKLLLSPALLAQLAQAEVAALTFDSD